MTKTTSEPARNSYEDNDLERVAKDQLLHGEQLYTAIRGGYSGNNKSILGITDLRVMLISNNGHWRLTSSYPYWRLALVMLHESARSGESRLVLRFTGDSSSLQGDFEDARTARRIHDLLVARSVAVSDSGAVNMHLAAQSAAETSEEEERRRRAAQ